jgi:hypothetical protein
VDAAPVISSIQDKQNRLAEKGENQLETVRNEIAALPAEELNTLLAELKAYATEQKWATRTLLRIEAGELETPMIQGALARLHWKKTRGTDWSEG